MSYLPAVLDASEVQVVSSRPEGVVLAREGAVVAIHLAPLQGERLTEIRLGIEAAARRHPSGLVLLSAFRLSPRFPLAPGFDSNIQELAANLRALDRVLVAIAGVVEFDGLRAAAFQAASRAVHVVARPRAALETFRRLSEALVWLAPHASRVGLPADPALFVRLYREADRRLLTLDTVTGTCGVKT